MSKSECAYTTGIVGTAIKTYNYTYGNAWKDQLTAFDGTAITYDVVTNNCDHYIESVLKEHYNGRYIPDIFFTILCL